VSKGTFTLTNVSFTFNSFKLLELPDAGLVLYPDAKITVVVVVVVVMMVMMTNHTPQLNPANTP
jgi:hypothetical protein